MACTNLPQERTAARSAQQAHLLGPQALQLARCVRRVNTKTCLAHQNAKLAITIANQGNSTLAVPGQLLVFASIVPLESTKPWRACNHVSRVPRVAFTQNRARHLARIVKQGSTKKVPGSKVAPHATHTVPSAKHIPDAVVPILDHARRALLASTRAHRMSQAAGCAQPVGSRVHMARRHATRATPTHSKTKKVRAHVMCATTPVLVAITTLPVGAHCLGSATAVWRAGLSPKAMARIAPSALPDPSPTRGALAALNAMESTSGKTLLEQACANK